MKSKSTEIKNRSIFENQVPRKMIGLLLKSDMSPSDLAEKIYGKKNEPIKGWNVRFSVELRISIQ